MVMRSPILNVMANAALKAARGLIRDFGEVEQLQVSVKGPGEFVSTADLKAERILRAELTRARPGYALLFEEGGATSGADQRHLSVTGRSSLAWSTSLPGTRCTRPRRASAPMSTIAGSGSRRAGSSARP